MRPGDSSSIENLFNEVAPRYDLINDVLSFGLHRLWKRQLLFLLRPSSGERWVDLCCGTGDMSLALARIVSPGGQVLGVDYASNPLTLANEKAAKEPLLSISWLKADVLKTGLPSAQFDGAVMAYGLRNLVDPGAGLEEIRRLIKPGSRAGVLDFNPLIEGSFAARFQKFYLRKLVVPLAKQLGLRDHYAYLEESLRLFPGGAEQERLALEVGFIKAVHRPIFAGQMGILLLQN